MMSMAEVRCSDCGRLLFKIEIDSKCPKCKNHQGIKFIHLKNNSAIERNLVKKSACEHHSGVLQDAG